MGNFCRGMLRQQENSMAQLPHDFVAKMPSDLQRLVGYASTIEGLGFTEGGRPAAALLGEGGKPLLKQEVAMIRPTARENFKRLLGHLEEHRSRIVSEDKGTGTAPLAAMRKGMTSKAEAEAELRKLEERFGSISQRIYELRKLIGDSKI